MSSMTYVRFIFFQKTFFLLLNKSIPCTVTPTNAIYLISKDKILTFKDLKDNNFILRVTYFKAR